LSGSRSSLTASPSDGRPVSVPGSTRDDLEHPSRLRAASRGASSVTRRRCGRPLFARESGGCSCACGSLASAVGNSGRSRPSVPLLGPPHAGLQPRWSAQLLWPWTAGQLPPSSGFQPPATTPSNPEKGLCVGQVIETGRGGGQCQSTSRTGLPSASAPPTLERHSSFRPSPALRVLKDQRMTVAVVRRWVQRNTDELATVPRSRYDVQLGLHLRDALELHVESRAEVGELRRLRLQLCVELFEGGHRVQTPRA